MKHIFLINKSVKDYNTILETKIFFHCQECNLDFKIIDTDSMDNMRNYARMYRDEDAIIYAVGGDGTLNLILNEIVGSRAKLGIIPMGTGNDFYHSLDEYKSEIIDVNVMKVNEQFGVNSFSLGIDAEILANKEKFRNLPISSKYFYYMSTIYTYFKYKNQVMGVNNDFEKRTMFTICNGSFYGGGYQIAPRASIHSKNVFIVSVDNMPKLEMPFFWLEVMKGKHEGNPYVDLYITDQEINIETMNILRGQLDGELMEGKEFRVVPNASSIEVVNNRNLIRKLVK